jgi:hypothetical protein
MSISHSIFCSSLHHSSVLPKNCKRYFGFPLF